MPALGANWKLNENDDARRRDLRQRRHEHELRRVGLLRGPHRREPHADVRRADVHVQVRRRTTRSASARSSAGRRFQAEGVGSFAPFSSVAARTSRTTATTPLSAGACASATSASSRPWLSVGASYQTEMEMGKFEEYAGLFAEQGDFDIPANWTVGVAIKPVESVTLAFDVQQINYSETESDREPAAPEPHDGAPRRRRRRGLRLEGRHGLQVRPPVGREPGRHGPRRLRLREAADPGVRGPLQHPRPRRHRAAHHGRASSAKVGDKSKFNFAVVRALSHSVTGPNPLEVPGRQTIELKMDQWVFDLGLLVRVLRTT